MNNHIFDKTMEFDFVKQHDCDKSFASAQGNDEKKTIRHEDSVAISRADSKAGFKKNELNKNQNTKSANDASHDSVENDKTLPIMVLHDKDQKLSKIERMMLNREYRVEMIVEHIKLSLNESAVKNKKSIIFEHKNTICELIIDSETEILTDNYDTEINLLIERPELYIRSLADPLEFPCVCCCILDDENFSIFDDIHNLKEKVKLIKKYTKLPEHQRAFVASQAKRPKYNSSDAIQETSYTPISDKESLDMMYRICRETYSPAVRAKVELLFSQLDGLATNADKADILTQLTYILGIDTSARQATPKTPEQVMAIFDKHIYGMSKLKKAITEYIIAMQYSGSTYCEVLLVGPPGVGKTSVCEAIAECFDIPLVHIDCSGVDTITMSGLIKSYSGAKTGKIIDGYLEKGSTNVCLRLDEIDKMARGKDGDPYGALIKPLGPQRTFFDEFIAQDIDVSSSKIIATANDISLIPGYIINRFENNIFYIDAYSADEKAEIAKNYLIPKKLREFRISDAELTFDDVALNLLADKFCNDEGARKISGYITTLIRKVITGWCSKNLPKPFTVDTDYILNNLEITDKPVTSKTRIGFI